MKKKFLAFLLTLMMVAVLVPAIVASAVAAPLGMAVQATDETADERAEVAVHDPLLDEDNVEVLNKDGVRVGYYETLADAVADLRAGDTVRLLDNVSITSTLVLSGDFVLDGNGFMLTKGVEEAPEPEAPVEPEIPVDPEDGEDTEVSMPVEPEDPSQPGEEAPVAPEESEGTDVSVEGGDATVEPLSTEEDLTEAFDAAISVVDGGSNIEIRNLIVSVPEVSFGIKYKPDYEAASALTLSNCSVMACDMAVWVYGENAHLTIKGTGSSYYGYQAIAVTRGYADIYGGSFAADSEVLGARNATVAVYGGTFLLGDSPFDVIGAHENATVILAGGEYATTAESGATVFYTEGGEIKVLDGKYYLADADAVMIDGSGVEIYSGYFYGQTEVDLTAATVDAAYTAKSYIYEDPTFPANTKLDYVKELGYLAMKQVIYDAAWLAAAGYEAAGTAYDVTNGVYNEYPVSYYAFELERAYWYLGNGGSLTVTQDVDLELDAALTFRARPETSVVTLQSTGVGDAALTLRVNSDSCYALVATGGVYNIADLKLVNDLGSAVLLDDDNTDAMGSTLNLYSGASVSGYDNHAIWVGAYATLNMYAGSYVHAAAGVNGNYDGTGFAVVAMVGGNFNMYGGNLGYARVANEDGRMVDLLATGMMNTVAVGVGEAATCVSNINVYNGKLGKSQTNMSNATAIFNLTDQSERVDGTKLYIEGGEFNSAMNSIIRCSDRNIEVLIKDGTFNGPTVQGSNAGHSDLIYMNGLSADIYNTIVIEGGAFSGGRDQFTVLGYANLSVSNTTHTGAMSAVFALHGNSEATPVTITNVSVTSTVVPFYCNGSALNVIGGEFNISRSSWGHCGFQLANNSATAGDITVTGGVYNISNGYFVTNNGTAKRTVTLNDVNFNSAGVGGSGICMNDSGGADVVINGGVYSNMISGNHQIETWGDPTKTVGTLTINGDAQFVRGGSASGRMIKFYGSNSVTINGGYFNSKTSEAFVIEKSADRSYAPSLTFTINGGTFLNEMDGRGLIYIASGLSTTLNITDGVFQNYSNGWGPCLDVGGTTNIYGGSFESICSTSTGSDACITVSNGTCNIYAGTFRGNGMCVARGLAGVTAGGESNVNGTITTVSNSRLNIYGGVLILENNPARTAGNYNWDAVIRCGGGSTYAFVSIYGGTFINNSGCSERVISKNNVHSSVNVTGGVFLASDVQQYYFKSSGKAGTGCTENPTAPLAKGADDPIVTYGDKQYHQHVLGAGASPFNGKMEDGAQIRLVKNEDGTVNGGIRFVSRYTANAVTSLKSLAGGSLDNVTFGTLIVKSELLEGVSTISHASLKQSGIEDYMDIVAKDGVTGSESVGLTVNAAVTNISSADYETVYAAVGYAMVTLSDGGHIYFYTEFDAENNSRSIAQVATAALADVSDTQAKGYVHPHITMDGMFSRYTAEEQAVLQTYIPTAEEAPEVSE